jgi:MerR family transcriptional regulator, redox-sensitive transcriptional activator SoxR
LKGIAVKPDDIITIGALAERTGQSVSAIRFYEARGLIHPHRSAGGQRRFLRSDIRRVSFIRIAQQLGLSIEAIGLELARLPLRRTPTVKDWAQISQTLAQSLDRQIAALQATRDRLDGCIGCGCLSLTHCALYNRNDQAASKGSGPRYLLGDAPPMPES